MRQPLLYAFISCKVVCIRPCSHLLFKMFKILEYLHGTNIITKLKKKSFDTT